MNNLSGILLLCFIAYVSAKSYNINVNYECIKYEDTKCTKYKISGSAGDTYTIDTYKTCINFNDNGSCDMYSLTGDITEDKSSCFNENTFVQTLDGPKRIKDIKIGDMVLAYDKAEENNSYIEIYTWIHRIINTTATFYSIKTEHGYFSASSKHLIAVENGFKFTSELKYGDLIPSTIGMSKVIDITKGKANGLYAPYNVLSNIYISDVEEGPYYLAHNFAHIKNPTLYENPFYYTLIGYEYMFGKPEITDNFLHPVADMSQSLFPFLVVDNTIKFSKSSSYNYQHTSSSSSSSSSNKKTGDGVATLLAILMNNF